MTGGNDNTVKITRKKPSKTPKKRDRKQEKIRKKRKEVMR